MAYGNKGSAYGNKGKAAKGKFTKGNDKFLMMQVGKQYLDETDRGYKTRIVFSTTNDEYSWCIREGGTTTHWFGVTKGRELLLRAIQAGAALGTSAFFERDDELSGNPRVNIKDVATAKELAKAKQDAENQAWEDADEEAEEEDAEEEEEEPAPKAKAKSSKRSYPALEEETEEEDDLPM
jgi:flagellar biosynthesis GTPase FlhF